jgi:WD40 repeat protein
MSEGESKAGESKIPCRILTGHPGWVTSASFSPDSKRIVSGSLDETVRIWDASSGHCVLTLEGHTECVTSVSFSPDGARIVSGSSDKTVRVWQYSTLLRWNELLEKLTNIQEIDHPMSRRLGNFDSAKQECRESMQKCVKEFKGLHGSVRSVSFSPDGARIVSGSADKTVRVWDVSSDKAGFVSGQCVLGPLQGHTNWVQSVSFSPDGARIVSGSEDKTVKVWDAHSGALLNTLKGHMWGVYSVSFSPDGARLVSGSVDNTVRVWDVSSDKAGFVSGQCVLTLEGHTDGVNSVSWDPTGARIVSGSDDNTVRVWDAVSGQCVLTLEGHVDVVLSVSFSPDSTRIVSGSEDWTVRVWDVSIISEWDQLKHEIETSFDAFDEFKQNKGIALNRIMSWRWYTPWLKSVKKRADDVGFVIDDAEYARLNALLVDMANRGGGGGGGGGETQRSLAIHLRL